MKITAEMRKHLVTKSYTRNHALCMVVNIENAKIENKYFSCDGKFDSDIALFGYLANRYSTTNEKIVQVISNEESEVKRAIYDYDFMRLGRELYENEKFTANERKNLITRSFKESIVSARFVDIEKEDFFDDCAYLGGDYSLENCDTDITKKAISSETVIATKIYEVQTSDKKYGLMEDVFLENSFVISEE